MKELFPHSKIQRCRVHKLRNVMDHVPEKKKAYVRAAMRSAWKLHPKEGMGRMEDLAKKRRAPMTDVLAAVDDGMRAMHGRRDANMTPFVPPCHPRPDY